MHSMKKMLTSSLRGAQRRPVPSIMGTLGFVWCVGLIRVFGLVPNLDGETTTVSSRRDVKDWRVALSSKARGEDFAKHLLYSEGDIFVSVANHGNLRGHQPFNSRMVDKVLPARSVTPKHGTCALVGNSGILKKGGYGKSIDDHDVIMRINQAPSNGYEDVVGSQTTYRMLNNKWTTVYYEDNVANTNVPGGTSQLARYLLKQEPSNVTFIVSRASTQQFETLATTVQRRRKDMKTPMLLSSRLVSGARNMLVAFRASAGSDQDGSPKYAEEEVTPSTGLLGVYFLLQVCRKVSVYGFSLDDSRRTNDMKAEGLRYHYFKRYADSERLLAHPHHNFALEGDILRKMDALGIISLCTPGLHEIDSECKVSQS